jgi:hypothetical protein
VNKSRGFPERGDTAVNKGAERRSEQVKKGRSPAGGYTVVNKGRGRGVVRGAVNKARGD